MLMNNPNSIEFIVNQLGISHRLADDLLTLAGGNINTVITCSKATNGLDQCKTAIINKRFSRLERKNHD